MVKLFNNDEMCAAPEASILQKKAAREHTVHTMAAYGNGVLPNTRKSHCAGEGGKLGGACGTYAYGRIQYLSYIT